MKRGNFGADGAGDANDGATIHSTILQFRNPESEKQKSGRNSGPAEVV